MKILLVGSGGRESALAQKISRDAQLFAFMGHVNPSIDRYVHQSSGAYALGEVTDGKAIANFALTSKVDFAVVSSDNPLEAGVVDALRNAGIPSVGPTRAGAEIEWNKVFARQLLAEVLPEYTPRFWVIDNEQSLKSVFELFESDKFEIVVKPSGLTGGKGVKVMGEHLRDLAEAKSYAKECLIHSGAGGKAVVIEEKLSGPEFTLQAITDGKSFVRVPATYDYPFRYDGDKGPGTGGMGSFCDRMPGLSFLTPQIHDKCFQVVKVVLETLRERGLHFSGVLNAGFFLTPRGLRVMEFNARFGDPECINIMALLDSSATELLAQIAHRELDPSRVRLGDRASVTKYLVAPEYACAEGRSHVFSLNRAAVEERGVDVHFASAIATDVENQYTTLGNSRNVALAATAKTPGEASDVIESCIADFFSGPLEHRKDIGARHSLEAISKLAQHR